MCRMKKKDTRDIVVALEQDSRVLAMQPIGYVMRRAAEEIRKLRSCLTPVAWELVDDFSGEVLRRSKSRVLVAGWRRVIGATVVPVYDRKAKAEN